MDLRLQLLDSFTAQGSDGATYKVCAYDRLARDPSLPDMEEHWDSTGQMEYRLEDGRLVEVEGDGSAHVVGSELKLTLPARAAIRETVRH